MSRIARLFFCGALFLSVSLLGQPPNPGPGTDQDQGAGQEPTIRVNVDLVNVYFTV